MLKQPVIHQLLGMAVLLLCPLLAVPVSAQVSYQEGVHYVELPVPVRRSDPEKIEVTEYFSYGCPHCYRLEPHIVAWKEKLGSDVVFNRTPAIWNQPYQIYAQIYYTVLAMHRLERVHSHIFDAIHRRQIRLNDPKQAARFLAEYGVDPVDFAKTYESFGVRAAMRQAEARGRAYKSRGVPAMIVNGKYRVEGGMAGSNRAILDVVDFLVEKERLAVVSE